MLTACALRAVWQEVRDVTTEVLDRTTFAHLMRGAGGLWVRPAGEPSRRTRAAVPG
jgi:DNA-binding IscR family transcriptional regulator